VSTAVVRTVSPCGRTIVKMLSSLLSLRVCLYFLSATSLLALASQRKRCGALLWAQMYSRIAFSNWPIDGAKRVEKEK